MTLLMFIYYRYYRLCIWMETTRTPNHHNDNNDSCQHRHHHHTYHTATPASHDPPSIGGFSYYIKWGARDALLLKPQVYFFCYIFFLLY